MAEKLSDTDVDMIELNISCPNVKQGGVASLAPPVPVWASITEAVRKYCQKAPDGKALPQCCRILAKSPPLLRLPAPTPSP